MVYLARKKLIQTSFNKHDQQDLSVNLLCWTPQLPTEEFYFMVKNVKLPKVSNNVTFN